MIDLSHINTENLKGRTIPIDSKYEHVGLCRIEKVEGEAVRVRIIRSRIQQRIGKMIFLTREMIFLSNEREDILDRTRELRSIYFTKKPNIV